MSTPRCFVDTSGLPYGLVIPELVHYPAERVAIHGLYPGIAQFAASGGTRNQNFYQSAILSSAFPIIGTPSLPLGGSYPVDLSCAAP